MALLDDIGNLLEAAAVTGGATGWLLNKSFMTDEQDQVVTVTEGVSRPSDHTSGTAHDFPAVQVLVRGAKLDYATVRTKVDAAITALNDVAVSGQVFMLLRQSPLPLGVDALQRPMISVNFDIMRVRT